MYKKQDINDFIAFRSLFDDEISDAIYNNDIEKIEKIMKVKYLYETENDFYIHTNINLKIINDLINDFTNEIKDNPFLIYKL